MRTSYNTHAVITASYYCKMHNISKQPSVFFGLIDLFDSIGADKSRRYRSALKLTPEPVRYPTLNSVCKCIVRGSLSTGLSARQEDLFRAMRIKN